VPGREDGPYQLGLAAIRSGNRASESLDPPAGANVRVHRGRRCGIDPRGGVGGQIRVVVLDVAVRARHALGYLDSPTAPR